MPRTSSYLANRFTWAGRGGLRCDLHAALRSSGTTVKTYAYAHAAVDRPYWHNLIDLEGAVDRPREPEACEETHRARH